MRGSPRTCRSPWTPCASGVGCQNCAGDRDLGFLGGSLVFVEETAKDRSALDLFLGEISHGVAGPWWLELECTVRSSPVVVPDVLGHHDAQVPFAEDQHPI